MKQRPGAYNILRIFMLSLIIIGFFGCGSGNQNSVRNRQIPRAAEYPMKTIGPNGEEPVSYESVVVSDPQIQEIKKRSVKAAILLHTSSEFTRALIEGAKTVFDSMDIEIVAVTDSEMDSNKQRVDIETALALNPDILITLVLDPVSGAAALRPAVEQGVKVVLISNLPRDFVHGRDYATVVSDDLYTMGASVARMIGTDLNGSGNVALLYHDADFYVTNYRDRSVENVLRKEFPDINIVTARGIANPDEGEVLASAIITQNPGIDAIYAPWDTIAEGVVAAVRASGREDLKVYTIDLGANNSLDLVKDGNMAGIVADMPFDLGMTLARAGVLSLLGEPVDPFVIVPSLEVTSENILYAWQISLQQPAPKEIFETLEDRKNTL